MAKKSKNKIKSFFFSSVEGGILFVTLCLSIFHIVFFSLAEFGFGYLFDSIFLIVVSPVLVIAFFYLPFSFLISTSFLIVSCFKKRKRMLSLLNILALFVLMFFMAPFLMR